MKKVIIIRRRKLGKTSTEGIANQMISNISVLRYDLGLVPEDTDLVIRWGCTANTGVNNTLNTAKAIHQVNDKIAFRRLIRRNLPTAIPKTWFNIEEWANEAENYPKVIVRPIRHAQGRNLLLVDTNTEGWEIKLHNFITKFPEYYISEYINKVAEYRVFVAQGRAVWVAQKTPGNPQDIAWNVAQGGRFDNVRWGEWPLKVVKTAIEVFNLTELDFGGVDVMVDANNNTYVLEINSAPSQTSPYRQFCVAKVFDHIINNDKNTIPLINQLGDWKKFIHPALSEDALI